MARWDTLAGPEINGLVQDACAQFQAQVRAHLPLGRLAVVLLDSRQATGQVVFSWKAPPDRHGTRQSTTLSDGPGLGPMPRRVGAAGIGLRGPGWTVGALLMVDDDRRQAISITLEGSQEVLGAALLHAPAADGYGPTEQHLARHLAGPLSLALDNIRLQQMVQRREETAEVLQLIAETAVSGAAMGQLYRRFAAQVKRLVDYYYLGVYLAGSHTDRLTRRFQTGLGVRRSDPGTPVMLAESEWAAAVFQGRGHIDQGRSAARPAGQTPTLFGSAVTVPVVFSERVLGALRLGHGRPGAYRPDHLEVLQWAASLLGPRIAHGQLRTRFAKRSAQREKRGQAHSVDTAHALCNPLTAIKGYSSSLLQSDLTWPPEVQREFPKTIDQEADRLERAVRELLARPAKS